MRTGPTNRELTGYRGEPSIGFLGWAEWPESPRIGYAPLESRTKRWAAEPQIEGWFPLSSGERYGCEGLSDCDAEPTSAPTRVVEPATQSKRTPAAKKWADGVLWPCVLTSGPIERESKRPVGVRPER